MTRPCRKCGSPADNARGPAVCQDCRIKPLETAPSGAVCLRCGYQHHKADNPAQCYSCRSPVWDLPPEWPRQEPVPQDKMEPDPGWLKSERNQRRRQSKWTSLS